jgi:hypothetical protein
MVSLVVGVVGLFLAFIPHYVGLIGLAAGGCGVAAGTIGVLFGGQRRLALSGTALSALAVVMAAIMTFGYPDLRAAAVRPAGGTTGTRTVLGKEVGVQIGAFTYTPTPRSTSGIPVPISLDKARLAVNLTNKLTVSRRFSLTIAGFETEHIQIDAFTVQATLDGMATREVNAAYGRAVSDEKAQRLKTATFAVLAASSDTPEKP